ncbi:MAG: hypothetical protein IIV77_03440 [Bacteroidaceae bacterium]|nr:hypothetical protein [Bacteroidaceae bacterium]
MKKLFSFISMFCMSMIVFAQGSLLATLSHDGNISAFYGASALKSAVAAAESGDVITLSSGQFSATNITKPITLRGAGMSISTDSLNAHEATIIQGSFTINIADSLEGRLAMEGLYFNNGITYSGILNNAQFLKCRFLNFIAGTNALSRNTSFIHCRIYDGYTQEGASNAFFINCAVGCPQSTSTSASIEFSNCFIKFDDYSSYGNYANDVINAYYKNCIIQTTNPYYENKILSSCTAYYCVGLGYNELFTNISGKNSTNKYVSDIKSVFKTYTTTSFNTYIQDRYNFKLTDEAAAKYLGTDGTQVGMYGGNLTYDENPTIPQITKCNVAAKSTADGKLSVDIEVKAAEY